MKQTKWLACFLVGASLAFAEDAEDISERRQALDAAKLSLQDAIASAQTQVPKSAAHNLFFPVMTHEAQTAVERSGLDF